MPVSSAGLSDAPRPTLPSHQQVSMVGPGAGPARTVGEGERITLSCLDASGNQIRPGVAPEAIHPERLFPVSEPVFLEGVAAGEAVAVTIEDIRPATMGHLWTRTGLGLERPTDFAVIPVPTDNPALTFGETVIPLSRRLHVGVVGVLPATSRQARDTGDWGGNMDTPRTAVGAVVHLPAQVQGGGVFVGDCHAAIGDGEICGTGVECAADIDLVVRRSPSRIPWPVIEFEGLTSLVTAADTVEAAVRSAIGIWSTAVSQALSLSASDTYFTVASTLRLRVLQLVNPHVTVESWLESGLDRHLLARGHDHPTTG